jgi:hypothetical protein
MSMQIGFIKKLVPTRYHYALSRLKNIFRGYKEAHYSQFGEDIVLQNIFKGQREGTYVDVGAHHPRRYSNTYLLYKCGWHGTNIDPNPHTKKLFDSARPNDTNIACGVGLEGMHTYYQFSDPALNTFNKEEAQRWMHKPWVTYKGEVDMPIRPLCALVSGPLDLLTVDAEGMDLEVLQSADWQNFQPRVIVVESGAQGLQSYVESKG